jgi:hypothetical protein
VRAAQRLSTAVRRQKLFDGFLDDPRRRERVRPKAMSASVESTLSDRCAFSRSCLHALYLFKSKSMAFVGQFLKQTKKENDHIHPCFSKSPRFSFKEIE